MDALEVPPATREGRGDRRRHVVLAKRAVEPEVGRTWWMPTLCAAAKSS
ncbi:MAG: hypothetical protein ABWY65_07310 [Thermoleophilaceae bacterium]